MLKIRLLDYFGLLLLATKLIAQKEPHQLDPGLGWHLLTGKWIFENGKLPEDPLFWQSKSSQTWVCDQWLSDLFLFFFHQRGGVELLYLLTLAIVFLAFTLVLRPLLLNETVSELSTSLSLIAALLISSPQLIIRPVIFSILLFAIVYRITTDYLSTSRPSCFPEASSTRSKSDLLKTSLVLFLIFALWANLHPGFIAALILVWLASFVAFFRSLGKKPLFRLLFELICLGLPPLLATLLNPFGIQLHRSVLSLVANEYFMNLNLEWQGLNLWIEAFQLFPLAILLFISGLALDKQRRITFWELLTTAFFLTMALNSTRNVIFFAVVAALPLGKSMDILLSRLRAAFRAFYCKSLSQALRKVHFRPNLAGSPSFAYLAFIILSVSMITGYPIYRSQVDSLTLTSLSQRQLVAELNLLPPHARLFHTPNWGGLIAWNGWPKHQVFIDDRNQIIPPENYQDYFRIAGARPGWEGLLEKYQVNYLLLDPSDPLRLVLENGQQSHIQSPLPWRLLRSTPEIVVFEKTS